MALYRANIRLSQQLFSILHLFEIALRNKVNEHYSRIFQASTGSSEWLYTQAQPGGFMTARGCEKTLHVVHQALADLAGSYTHDKLVAELTFGFWRYLFASKQFRAGGSNLLQIFPHRPIGTNHTLIYNKLKEINDLRNRIAHHEPICFDRIGNISCAPVLARHQDIVDMLSWMKIQADSLFFGFNHISAEVSYIHSL